MTKDSLILSWQEPEKDGGSKIIDYIVEYRESSEKEWKSVGTTEGNETYIHVKKLKRKTKYFFKICARNEAGVGLPLVTDEAITIDDKISKFFIFELPIHLISFTDLLINFLFLAIIQRHHHRHEISRQRA